MFDVEALGEARKRAIHEYVVASANLLDLKIKPDWQEQVTINFCLLAAAAASVNLGMQFDAAESSMVFSA